MTMEYTILNVSILGEIVIIKYLDEKQEKEIKILLKTYVDFPFYTEQKIELNKWKLMLKKDEENLIYNEAYNHLKKSDLTSDELSNKLLKKHPNRKLIINKIIKEFKEKNLLNDEHFVSYFIRKGINSFKGVERIKYELSLKGINEEMIYQNLNDELLELEKEKAYILGNKQMRLSKKLDFRKMRDKVYYKLSYAGYSKELIEEIMFKLNLIKEI